VKFGAVSNIALAILAALSSKWENGPAKDDVMRVFFLFFALDALINLFTLLYGSLSFVSLVNAAIDAGLAYFYGQRIGLVPSPKPTQ